MLELAKGTLKDGTEIVVLSAGAEDSGVIEAARLEDGSGTLMVSAG